MNNICSILMKISLKNNNKILKFEIYKIVVINKFCKKMNIKQNILNIIRYKEKIH